VSNSDIKGLFLGYDKWAVTSDAELKECLPDFGINRKTVSTLHFKLRDAKCKYGDTEWFLARSQNWEKRLLAPSCLSVCLSAWNKSSPIGRIFMKFDIWVFFESLPWKFEFYLKSDKNSGYFTWRLCTFLIISRRILLRMRNVSDKSCRENQNTFSVQ
jgi:hypothetical protein